MTDASPSPAPGDNPLLADWTTPFRAPPFGAIRPEHFAPAFDTALARHRAEVAAIAAEAATPTFANTIGALERSGRALSRVSAAFFALVAAHSNDALLGIERDIVPRLAAHWDAIYMNQALFRRIEALRRDQGGLDAEEARVLDRYFVTFRRAGAGLDAAARGRLAEIGERLAVLGTQFSQRVLADEQGYVLPLNAGDELAGLPAHVVEAARSAAQERGLPSPGAVTLARSSVEPFLQFSQRRDLRGEGFPGLDRARRRRRGRQPAGHRRRWCGFAARRRGSSAIRPGRITGSTMPWPRPRRPRAASCRKSGRRRAGAHSPTATPCRR